MKEEEKNYITAFVCDDIQKYLSISLSPVLSSEPISCKFGICQVGFKRDSDRLSPPFSHLVSALSGRIYVRVTPTHMPKAFNMNIKQQKIQQYGPGFHQICIQMLQPLFQHMASGFCDCASVCYCRSISHQTTCD